MTAIPWVNMPGFAGEVWEPVRGCTPVSEGCRNCYARRLAEGRLRRFYPKGFKKVELVPDQLEKPLHWRKPRAIFVCSRSDLFHHSLLCFDYWLSVFDIIRRCPQHLFLILTKRPQRMLDVIAVLSRCDGFKWPDNAWAGVSVENQEWANERLPLLAQVPARMRFVSCEPLLSAVDLKPWLGWTDAELDALPADAAGFLNAHDAAGSKLHWVIVGAESGPGHRPCKVEWIEDVVRHCREAGVPCYVKQASGPRPGMQGRIPDDLWAVKEFP